MIRVILLCFAILVFVLLAAQVIDQDTAAWANAAFAAGFASFLPWPA